MVNDTFKLFRSRVFIMKGKMWAFWREDATQKGVEGTEK